MFMDVFDGRDSLYPARRLTAEDALRTCVKEKNVGGCGGIRFLHIGPEDSE